MHLQTDTAVKEAVQSQSSTADITGDDILGYESIFQELMAYRTLAPTNNRNSLLISLTYEPKTM